MEMSPPEPGFLSEMWQSRGSLVQEGSQAEGKQPWSSTMGMSAMSLSAEELG